LTSLEICEHDAALARARVLVGADGASEAEIALLDRATAGLRGRYCRRCFISTIQCRRGLATREFPVNISRHLHLPSARLFLMYVCDVIACRLEQTFWPLAVCSAEIMSSSGVPDKDEGASKGPVPSRYPLRVDVAKPTEIYKPSFSKDKDPTKPSPPVRLASASWASAGVAGALSSSSNVPVPRSRYGSRARQSARVRSKSSRTSASRDN